jgi:hypothetical protein
MQALEFSVCTCNEFVPNKCEILVAIILRIIGCLNDIYSTVYGFVAFSADRTVTETHAPFAIYG